jgi:hypothetical protein
VEVKMWRESSWWWTGAWVPSGLAFNALDVDVWMYFECDFVVVLVCAIIYVFWLRHLLNSLVVRN